MINEKRLYSLLSEYVNDAIDGTSYDINTDGMSNVDKMKFFLDTYISEYVTPSVKRAIPSKVQRIQNYLQGLPSCIGIEFRDYNIGLIGESWGVVTNDKERSIFISKWFEVVAKFIFKRILNDSELTGYLNRI